MDLKPVMFQDVRKLEPREVKVEEIRRNSLLKEVNSTTIFYEMGKCRIPHFAIYVNNILLYFVFTRCKVMFSNRIVYVQPIWNWSIDTTAMIF